MAINGLLTKVMFDKNPGPRILRRESFPLEWNVSAPLPYGIIMKINRQQLPELTQEMVDKDHEFWSKYSARAIGNWITYDTLSPTFVPSPKKSIFAAITADSRRPGIHSRQRRPESILKIAQLDRGRLRLARAEVGRRNAEGAH